MAARVGGAAGSDVPAQQRSAGQPGRAHARRADLDGGRPVVLDDADRRLIELLRIDGRTSNRAIAAEIGLTEVTVAARLRALTERGVLYIMASLDWRAAGYRWEGWLEINVEGRSPRDVAADLSAIDGVHLVGMTYGRADLIVHIVVPTQQDVLELVDGTINRIDGIGRVTIAGTLETVKFEHKHASWPAQAAGLRFPDPVVDLDETDHALIAALVADGRQSNREIARQLHVSESTVRVRLKRIEAAGLLRISARTDPNRTGEITAGAFIWVDAARGAVRRVAAQLAALEQTDIVEIVTGGHDILVGVNAHDERQLVDFVLEQIREVSEVRATTTAVITRIRWVDFKWARFLGA